MISKDGDDGSVVSTLTRQMKEIYRIVSICLGIPPETFTWEYYDKSKAYHKIGPVTPLEFYNEYVKPVYNVEDKVSDMWDHYVTLSCEQMNLCSMKLTDLCRRTLDNGLKDYDCIQF